MNPYSRYPPYKDIIKKHEILLNQKLQQPKPKPTRTPLNLTALKTLKNNKQIFILLVDKKMGVCALDNDTYYEKAKTISLIPPPTRK